VEAVDVSRAEIAEAQIRTFIERRAEKNGEERPEEEMYAASVRRYHSRRREEIAAAWCSYHQEQAARLERTAARLAASHRDAARKLMEKNHGKETA
jgi:hypothetical protein